MRRAACCAVHSSQHDHLFRKLAASEQKLAASRGREAGNRAREAAGPVQQQSQEEVPGELEDATTDALPAWAYFCAGSCGGTAWLALWAPALHIQK